MFKFIIFHQSQSLTHAYKGAFARTIKRVLASLFLLGLGLIVGCDSSTELPNKYKYLPTRDGNHAIIIFPPEPTTWKQVGYTPKGPKIISTDIAIGPGIVKFAEKNGFVYGLVANENSSQDSYISVPGWFILDTSSAFIYEGLTYDDMVLLLREKGLSSELTP